MRRTARTLVLVCLTSVRCGSGDDHSRTPGTRDDTTAPAPDTAPTWTVPADGVGGNVLLILSDDQGIDKVAAYGAHPEPPRTPVLDALAADGVLFRRAYAHPVCSPTRAAILTGRYNSRYGLGEVIHPHKSGFSLRETEVTLPEALDVGGYGSAAFGKWHLAGFSSASGTEHPLVQGFRSYKGTQGNIGDEAVGTGDGILASYYYFQKNDEGELSHVNVFGTSDIVDDALAAIAELPEPWFVYVAFNAPHKPLTLAPDDLHTNGDLDINSSAPDKHAALVESMDTEIGRLLSSMSPAVRARTTVIFTADNGTEAESIRPPWRQNYGKDSPFEGGIHVPLIVHGAAVVEPGREVDALVHSVDLYATVLALAGVDPAQVPGPTGEPVVLDGVSFLPQLRETGVPSARTYVHTGKFSPNGAPNGFGGYGNDWDIVLDERWKYIRGFGDEKLYDLSDPDPTDGLEGENLLVEPLSEEAQAAYDRLVAELAAKELAAAYEEPPQ